MTQEEKKLLSILLKEVSNTSLQMVLRKVLFSGASVTDALIEERPEIVNEFEDQI